MAWPTTADGQYYIFEGRVLIPIDPSTGVAQLYLRPQGGIGVGIPAIAKGEDGDTPTFHPVVNLTPLAYDDTSDAEATFTPLGSNVYQLNLALHEGAPGVAGSNATVMNANDVIGSPVFKYILSVNSALDGLEYAPQRVGDRYIPGMINSIAAGNPNATLCEVVVPPQPFDWRPRAEGYCLITGTGSNVQVDVVARLNNPNSGAIVGRGTQRAGQSPPTHVLTPGPPPGSSDIYDKVLANDPATIYFRAERQTGSDTFTTSSATTLFSVEVNPIP